MGGGALTFPSAQIQCSLTPALHPQLRRPTDLGFLCLSNLDFCHLQPKAP